MTTGAQIVYVVDDDPGMLESTAWLLESVGLDARPFTNGGDFLDACATGKTPVCYWMCACRLWVACTSSKR